MLYRYHFRITYTPSLRALPRMEKNLNASPPVRLPPCAAAAGLFAALLIVASDHLVDDLVEVGADLAQQRVDKGVEDLVDLTVAQAAFQGRTNHVMEDVNGLLLVHPEVTDEAAAASADVGGAVGVAAGQCAQFVGLVVGVTDVVAERRLLVGPRVGPVATLGEAVAEGAVVPDVKEFLGALAGLGDDEARVPEDPALCVLVVRRVGILGHGEHSLVGDVPEAHEPLDGHVGLDEDGICVEEDDESVFFKGLLNDRNLDPGVVAVGRGRRADELVVVAVDLGCLS
jgi:hypothetical protein